LTEWKAAPIVAIPSPQLFASGKKYFFSQKEKDDGVKFVEGDLKSEADTLKSWQAGNDLPALHLTKILEIRSSASAIRPRFFPGDFGSAAGMVAEDSGDGKSSIVHGSAVTFLIEVPLEKSKQFLSSANGNPIVTMTGEREYIYPTGGHATLPVFEAVDWKAVCESYRKKIGKS